MAVDLVFWGMVAASMLVGGGLLAWAARRERQWWQALVAPLAAEGFHASDPVERWQPGLVGTFESRAARLTAQKRGKHAPFTTEIVIAHEGPRAFTLDVVPETLGERVAIALGGVDVATADAAFDRRFRVRATDVPRATFVLGPDERRALLSLNLQRLTVDPENVTVAVWGRESTAAGFAGLLRTADAVARRLEATRE